MQNPIVVSNIISATDLNILSGTRLATAPGAGVLLVEFQAQKADATDSWAIDITLPGGDSPLKGMIAPATPEQVAGVIRDGQKFMAYYLINSGGSFSIGATLTGTNVLAYRVSWAGEAA